ncbi:MAG: type II toxin-antitoxin system YafQ family toxin [Oscillospiraceae bacterium]|nr:type II toxin-antitoxin system YafQ family toxin [Oscillospiraceae bacterium]
MQKRGYDLSKLDIVLNLLAEGQPLPPRNCDHELVGNYAGHRECHIQSDWLLVYRIDEDVLVLTLTRTGSHSDLF